MSAWTLYLLECADGRLYTGIAKDARKRFEQHRTGKGAAFTRINGARRLLATCPYASRGDALRAEHELRHRTREEKRAWALAHALPDEAG